jgi:hypothetical protein
LAGPADRPHMGQSGTFLTRDMPVASCLTRTLHGVRREHGLSRVRRLETGRCVAHGQHVQEIVTTRSFRPCAATS